MIAMTARLIGLLLLTVAAASGPVLAGSEDRRAEDAAASARRDKEATGKLRANKPAEHDRRALPGYLDALERAQWQAEKSVRKAADTAREAGRAARKAENAGRERQRRQRRDDRDARRQRQIDDAARRK